MSVPQPESTSSPGHISSKLSAENYTIQRFRWMFPLDVTTGNWENLYIWSQSEITNITPTAVTVGAQNVTNISNINFAELMGIPDGGVTTNPNDTVNNTSYTTFDNTLYDQFTWGRLNNVNVKLGNFMVSVERDSSGGIQWKDEPVFEIQMVPVVQFRKNGGYAAPFMPATTYTTTLKEGINMSCNFNMGLVSRENIPARVRDKTSTGSNVYFIYPEVGEWLNGEMRALKDNWEISWLLENQGYPRVENVIYLYYIRLVNIPRGLTNVKVTLGYTAELKANWDLLGRVITPITNRFLPEGAQSAYEPPTMYATAAHGDETVGGRPAKKAKTSHKRSIVQSVSDYVLK